MKIQPNSPTTLSWDAAKQIDVDVRAMLDAEGYPLPDEITMFRSASLYFPDQRFKAAVALTEHVPAGDRIAAVKALRTYGATLFETVNGSTR